MARSGTEIWSSTSSPARRHQRRRAAAGNRPVWSARQRTGHGEPTSTPPVRWIALDRLIGRDHFGGLTNRSVRLRPGSLLESAQPFLVSSDVVGDSLERGAQVGDLRGEPGQGARFSLPGAVFLHHGAQLRVAVEGGSAYVRAGGDRGEGDRLAGVEELGAGSFDSSQRRTHAPGG